ncbi:Mortality factor related protein 1 [Caenorhabditis elegans]|uniref:Isoform a of Mortality factor related protein 1 n=1 Tax=Caenorhabditis elegans TaxID=6239 RepID=A7DTF0-2|nr:Mortality factor related protein 1 [Caenorhabditis elegans]CAA21528.1 Mortality factor related protein 1 [Caenorhabditis elegans]|eukprot:NP_499675.1 human MRG (Mortality factor-Related Gene) related [Caenorhabditis elegans]
MSSKKNFEVGENVACIYKGKPYDAKITDIKTNSDGKELYCVHFKGWNNRYDEKIPVGEEKDRIFKGTASEYAEKHNAELPTTALKPKKKSLAAEAPRDDRDDTPGTSKGKKAKSVTIAPVMTADDMKVELPKPLRKILIDDYDLVCRYFINIVPHEYSVDQIIEDYIKTIPVSNEQMRTVDDLLIEYEEADIKITNLALICTARGLVDYFNVTLGYQLLYKFERPQYNDLVKKRAMEKGIDITNPTALQDSGFRPSQEYGIVHFLRMLAKLPDYLKLTQWNDHVINRIMIGVHDLIVFLNKNHGKYYRGSSDYQGASNDYYRRSLAADDGVGANQ